MTDFDEELLSAYLDGELPEAERARVEERLNEQPDSRRLLEELRSIKTTLKRLPRDRLPRDFWERVLRRAEREMLTSSGEPRPAPGFSWRRFRRPLAWAALSLAAGLLLMVFDRDRQPPAPARQVALAPNDQPSDIGKGRRAGDTPAEQDRRRAGETPAEQDAAGETPALQDGAGETPAPQGGAGETPTPQDGAGETPTPQDGAGETPTPQGGAGETPTPQDNAGETPAPHDEAGATPTPQDGAGETPTAQGEMPTAQGGFGAGREKGPLIGAPGDEAPGGLSDQALLVWCEVSPDSKYNERLRQVLLDNGIAWSDDTEDRIGGRSSGSKQSHGENAAKEPASPKAPPAPLLGRFAKSPNQQRLRDASQAALDADAELLLIEASEPRIKAVLAELRRDGDVFKAVNVEPAGDIPRQQQLGLRRRGTDAVRKLARSKASRPRKEQPAGKAGENRLRVLFILQPADGGKPAAAPADQQQPNQD